MIENESDDSGASLNFLGKCVGDDIPVDCPSRVYRKLVSKCDKYFSDRA